jgi:hypothetical protein
MCDFDWRWLCAGRDGVCKRRPLRNLTLDNRRLSLEMEAADG